MCTIDNSMFNQMIGWTGYVNGSCALYCREALIGGVMVFAFEITTEISTEAKTNNRKQKQNRETLTMHRF